MGYKDEFHWDDDKSDLLKRTRGYSLFEVADHIFSHAYVEYENRKYPQQNRAIGRIENEFITLAYEFIEDSHGAFIRLITYWPASELEKKIYKDEV